MPTTVGTSTIEVAIGSAAYRKAFYANGRFWVFYSDGTNMVYRTSTDGSTWSDAATVRACTSGLAFSIWFDGTYLHYAYGPNTNGGPLYYRRGTPNSDGTITCSAAEQIAKAGVTGEYEAYPCIIVDSGGYPWIGWRHWTTAGYPYVTKSSTNDGTWTTASGFPYQLSSSAHDVVLLVPLTGGNVFAFYAVANATIKGKLYTGSWGSEETCSANPPDQANVYSNTSAVAVGDDVWLLYKRATTYQVRYNKRTYGIGWGTDTLLQDTVDAYTGVTMSKDGTTLYAFWTHSPTHDHIYYKKCVGGTWDSSPTDWLTESNVSHLSPFNSYYESLQSKIGANWITGTASPFNVRHDYLTLGAATYTKTWTTDVLFKKLGLTKTAVVDAAFKKRDITKTFNLDAALKKQNIQIQKQVDALFKKLGTLKTFGVDVDFLKRDIIKSFAIDARFGAIVAYTISRQIDALFKKVGLTKTTTVDVLFKELGITKSFGIDAWFGVVGAVPHTKAFALDVIFAYKVKFPELWLSEDGKILINIDRPYSWVGKD